MYIIQVNIARKGEKPNWVDLTDYYDDACQWSNEEDARQALKEEKRGKNARLMHFDMYGVGRPLIFP